MSEMEKSLSDYFKNVGPDDTFNRRALENIYRDAYSKGHRDGRDEGYSDGYFEGLEHGTEQSLGLDA